MIRFPAAILLLLSAASLYSPFPASAASTAGAAAQSPCAAVGPSRGEGKFTGEISTEPTGAMLEVTSGNQSAVVTYNNAVQVCQGGALASLNALARGESVVVYGPMKRNGNTLEISAAKILIAGSPQSGMRTMEPVATRSSGESQPPASNAAPVGAAGGMPVRMGSQGSSGSKTATDDWTAQGGDAQGNAQGRGQGYSNGAIACNALLFTVNSPREAATGQAAGRTSVSGVTCKRAVDATSMEFTQDALTNRALSALTLSWQGQLEVRLQNAAVSSVQFTTDANGAQVVEVTFAYQKIEIAHLPSNTHMSW